ncbi:MAG: hypothetical protein V4543_17920 [Bacteroidota bacterium]
MEQKIRELRVPLDADIRSMLEQKQVQHAKAYGKKPTLPALLQEMARIGLNNTEGRSLLASDVNRVSADTYSSADLMERITELEASELQLTKQNKKLKKIKIRQAEEITTLKSAPREMSWQDWLMILGPSAFALWQTFKLNQQEQHMASFMAEVSKQLKQINLTAAQRDSMLKQFRPFIDSLPAEVQEGISKLFAGQQN